MQKDIMSDKKLKKLLEEYRVANSVRLRAYKKRSKFFHDSRVTQTEPSSQAIEEVEGSIKVARLFRLEVSKQLRAYCKKKKYHIRWGTSCNINRVITHEEWKLYYGKGFRLTRTVLRAVSSLKLAKTNNIHPF